MPRATNQITDILSAYTAPTKNSLKDYGLQGGWIYVAKTGHVLNGNGAQVDNIFTVTGACECVFWLEVTAVGNSTTCSTGYLNLNDGTMDAPISDSMMGLDLSGCVVGATGQKIAAKTAALDSGNNAQCQCFESATPNNGVLFPFGVLKKTGATTNIQYCFTGDANTNVTVTFYIRYRPLTSNGAIASA